MNPAIESMLSKYSLRAAGDYINALREILQEIVLCGLWRGKFFERAAFYGGTALRVFYGLDRFSEDMVFSLLAPDDAFRLEPYCKYVEDELGAWGFAVTVTVKEKRADTAVKSAFLKVGTQLLLLQIESPEDVAARFSLTESLKIKFEVDTSPPLRFNTETKFLLQPIPFSVRAFSKESLFAGKLHAVLCRSWKNRVKGRDWYDLVWYVGREVRLDLTHLESRMRRSGHYRDDAPLTEKQFRKILTAKIDTLDVKNAKADVERFLLNPGAVDVWSRDFFHAVAGRIAIM